MLDRTRAQVGELDSVDPRQPVAEPALLVGQALDRRVDDLGGHHLVAPVHRQLDRPVGDLPPRPGGAPGEAVGRRPRGLAREDPRHAVLGDEQLGAIRRPVGQVVGELGESLVDRAAQLVDELAVEHQRVAAATEEIERPALHRCELDHATDGTDAVSHPFAIMTPWQTIHPRRAAPPSPSPPRRGRSPRRRANSRSSHPRSARHRDSSVSTAAFDAEPRAAVARCRCASVIGPGRPCSPT